MFWKGNQQKLKAIRYVQIQDETFFRLKKLTPGHRKWKFLKLSRIIRNDVKHHQNMKTSWNRWFWISFNDKNDWKTKNSKISIVNLSFLKNEFQKQFATKCIKPDRTQPQSCHVTFQYMLPVATYLIKENDHDKEVYDIEAEILNI